MDGWELDQKGNERIMSRIPKFLFLLSEVALVGRAVSNETVMKQMREECLDPDPLGAFGGGGLTYCGWLRNPFRTS